MFQSHATAPVVYALRAPCRRRRAGFGRRDARRRRPVARPGLDTERIAVRLPDRRLDAYAGASWSAPLPQLVEALLVDAFRAAGGWRAVVAEQSAFAGRYLLQTEITDFSADYAEPGGAPLVRVALRGELGPRRRAAAGRERRGPREVRAAADRQREVAAAFEAAAAQAVARARRRRRRGGARRRGAGTALSAAYGTSTSAPADRRRCAAARARRSPRASGSVVDRDPRPTRGASARNSTASARVRFATERTTRSPHSRRVRERRDVAHVDAGADDRAAGLDGARARAARARRPARTGSPRRAARAPARRCRRPTPRRGRARSACAAASPGRVNANTRRPCQAATCAIRCAAAPKP